MDAAVVEEAAAEEEVGSGSSEPYCGSIVIVGETSATAVTAEYDGGPPLMYDP